MARKKGGAGEGLDGGGGSQSLFSTDFSVNVDFSRALAQVRDFDQTLDRVTGKLEKLNGMSPKGLGLPTIGEPNRLSRAGLGFDAMGLGAKNAPTVNPQQAVFSVNQLTGGQLGARRDPIPLVADDAVRTDGGVMAVTRQSTGRGRSNLEPVTRYESAFEQGAARQRSTAPYFEPMSPTEPLSRRQRVLQQRRFGRDDFLEGVSAQRAADRDYTVIPSDGTIRGALGGGVLPEATYPLRGPFDYRGQRYPSERLTARQRVLHSPNLREQVFTPQGADERPYTVLPPSEGMRALPSMEDVAGRPVRGAESYVQNSPYVVGEASAWQPTRRARVAGAVAPGYDFTRQGLGDLGAGASRLGDAFNHQRLMSAASSLFIAQQIGQTLGQLGQRTVGQSMKIDEYQALLANSLLGDGLGRRGADRLAERLIGSEFVPGMGGVSTSELGLSRFDLAERYKGLAPIVRIGSDGPEDFAQRLQRGGVLSSLLMARDPSQGQAGVNVALSELLAGGSTRFLSLSRRFELSNSQLRSIEAEMGGEGTADPVAVAIKALERMGIGPSYLATRAATMTGELEQSGALFANLRADTFEKGTGVLAENLRTVNDAFQTYRSTQAYTQQLERGGGAVAGVFDFITRPLTQGIAGNLLRGGGALDRDYLAQNAADLMTAGEQGGRRGFVSESGDIVAASEAFREAAQTIQGAHLERLLEQPQYSPQQQTGMDTLLGTGATIGGAMLLNRIFGGAGGLLLRGAMTAGVGTGATLAAAGAAAAPAAVVAGGALGVGATVAAYRRGAVSRDVFAQLQEDRPELLDELNVSSLQRSQINRFADRDGPLGTAYSMAMRNRDFVLNTVTGGRFGESTYGERGGTFDTFLAQQGQRSGVEGALADMASTEWQPGMTRAQFVGTMRGRVFDLQRQAGQNPDTPLGQYFQREDALELAMRAADRSFQTAPQDFNRGLLQTAVERAYAYDKPLGLVDPETRKRDTLPAGFSLEQGKKFVERIITDDQTIPGGVNQNLLTGRVNHAANRLEAAVNRAEGEGSELETAFRRLNLAQLPGIFSDIDPAPDTRDLLPGTVRRSALRQRDPSEYNGRGGLRVTSSKVPTDPAARLTTLPGTREDVRPERPKVMTGRRGFARASEDATARLLGGVATADHAEHLARGSRGGGGFDVLSASGQFKAPMGGELTYLRTPEDYQNPLYQDMFPGGRRTYGVSAVVMDRFGKSFSVSHLTDSETYRNGHVRKGGYLGAQGNTGLSRSSRYPGRNIWDGRLEDTGEFAYGAGSHGHIQFGQLRDGRYEELDPQIGPSYWTAPDSQKAAMGAVSFQVDNHIHIEPGAERQVQVQAIDDGLEKLRANLLTLVLGGDMERLLGLRDDIKASQGRSDGTTRPRDRGK